VIRLLCLTLLLMASSPRLRVVKTLTLDDIRAWPHPTFDIPTAARVLGVSRSYAFELARIGDFPCRLIRVGSRYRVPKSALLALLEDEPAGDLREMA
jgi:excisionase family DNA binding protein